MTVETGSEGILFQQRSSLHKALTTVFQNAIDYRDNMKFDNVKDIRKARLSQMFKYCKDVFAPAFMKTVEKETNLIVTKLIISGQHGISGMFAVNFAMDNENNIIQILLQQTGNSPAPKKVSEALKETMSMYKNLDTTTGKLTSNSFGAGNKRKISCIFYFDAAMAFLLHDFIPERMGELLTAEELAAIYIHEIGHVLTLVERSGHFFLTLERLSEHINKPSTNKEKLEFFETFLESGAPFLNEMAKNGAISMTLVDTTKKAAETAKYLLESEAETSNETTLSMIGQIAKTIFITLMYINIGANGTFLLGKMFEQLMREFSMMTDSGGKTSDLTQSPHNLYQLERMADEFVSRHGAGAALASGLNKFHKIIPVITVTGGEIKSTRLRKSGAFTMHLYVCITLVKFVGGFMISPVNYEEHVKRVERLIQNARVVFKNDLNVNDLHHFVDEYIRLERTLKDAKGGAVSQASSTIMNYLLLYTNPATILAMVTTGRFTADYEKQQNLIENLINNELYAVSAKFRRLANLAA